MRGGAHLNANLDSQRGNEWHADLVLCITRDQTARLWPSSRQ
jgi:hypothetical protein